MGRQEYPVDRKGIGFDEVAGVEALGEPGVYIGEH